MLDLLEFPGRLSQVRSVEPWELPEFSYESADAFLSVRSLSSGIHSVVTSGLPLDLYIDVQPGCPIVFFFNGAVPRNEDLKLPVFAGLRVLPAGRVTRVYISDPVMYLDKNLSLGWYAGSQHLPLQRLLPQIIRKIIAVTRPNKLIFTGGSGGGFASLYYSRLFSDSLCVVWNPQTDILGFSAWHIENYARVAFDIHDPTAIHTLLPNLIQTNLCTLYGFAVPPNFIIYLQNRSDKFHVQGHLKPFIAEPGAPVDEGDFKVGMVRERLFVHEGRWGEGHVTPCRAFLTRLYRNLLGTNCQWDELYLAEERLRSLIETSEREE